MSNINNNPNDIDDILSVLKRAQDTDKVYQVMQGVEKAIRQGDYPTAVWGNVPLEKTTKTVNPNNSIKRPKTSRKLEKFIEGVEELKDIIKKHPIITTLISTVTALGIVISLPVLKANSQINELSYKLGDDLEKKNYGQQQSGFFSKIKLTIEPSEFVDNMNLTSNSHMRLYILSTVIQDNDFDKILRELGYNGKEDYIKDLGFRHNENFRAGEQYSMEYGEKLSDLIKELNKNPELVPSYLEKYPELGFIYDKDNTYLVNGQIGTTIDNGRSH